MSKGNRNSSQSCNGEHAYVLIPSSKHVLETVLFKRSNPNKYIWCLIASGYGEAARDLSVPHYPGDFGIIPQFSKINSGVWFGTC